MLEVVGGTHSASLPTHAAINKPYRGSICDGEHLLKTLMGNKKPAEAGFCLFLNPC